MSRRWQRARLGEVLERTEAINPLDCPEREFEYVDVSSISNKTFRIEQTQRVSGKSAPSRARRIIRADDVLFATVRPTLRRVAIVPEELEGQLCSTGYFVFRPKPVVYCRFLFYFLLSDEFVGRMGKLQKGASYPAVTDTQVRSQPFAFPSVDEQRRLVGVLDQAFAATAIAKTSAKTKLLRLDELENSLIHEAFNGRL